MLKIASSLLTLSIGAASLQAQENVPARRNVAEATAVSAAVDAAEELYGEACREDSLTTVNAPENLPSPAPQGLDLQAQYAVGVTCPSYATTYIVSVYRFVIHGRDGDYYAYRAYL